MGGASAPCRGLCCDLKPHGFYSLVIYVGVLWGFQFRDRSEAACVRQREE